jgi:hypothetical protein
MRTVEITLDGQTCSGSPGLGTSLHDFLSSHGFQTRELLFDQHGKAVSTQFTLAHSVHGQSFTQKGEAGTPVLALTLDEVLATTV